MLNIIKHPRSADRGRIHTNVISTSAPDWRSDKSSLSPRPTGLESSVYLLGTSTSRFVRRQIHWELSGPTRTAKSFVLTGSNGPDHMLPPTYVIGRNGVSLLQYSSCQCQRIRQAGSLDFDCCSGSPVICVLFLGSRFGKNRTNPHRR